MNYVRLELSEDDALYVRKMLTERAKQHREEAAYCDEIASLITT
jgi:hypothetical protein